MKIPLLTLTVAALGATHLAQCARRHRQTLALTAAAMHQRLLSDTERMPELAAVSTPDLTHLPTPELVQALHTNRILALLTAKSKAGLITPHELSLHLAELAKSPAAQHHLNTTASAPAPDTTP